jgi:hypothetical protein
MAATIVGNRPAKFAREQPQAAAVLAESKGSKNRAGITLGELLDQIKVEMVKLGPYIDLDAIREAQARPSATPSEGSCKGRRGASRASLLNPPGSGPVRRTRATAHVDWLRMPANRAVCLALDLRDRRCSVALS